MTPDAIAAILVLLSKVQGTPYIPGGNSAAGTDCSGLASWVANTAVGRDPFSGRFSTANEASELASRGFVQGTAPNALVIGWNASHTAVKFGGPGAYQRQFTHYMHLPVVADTPPETPAPPRA
jgi:cell wall-associated NlpC family hydrolase